MTIYLTRYRIDGDALRDAREDALLSQRELRDISGVSADTICRLETEHRTAHGKTLRKLAKALKIDYRTLLVSDD